MHSSLVSAQLSSLFCLFLLSVTVVQAQALGGEPHRMLRLSKRSKDCNETFPGQANGWRGRQYTSPVGQSRHSHWRWSWNSTTFDSDDSSEFSSSAAESETGSQAQFIRVTSAADSAASSASSSASSSSAAPSSSSSVFSSSSLSSSSSSSSSPSSSPPPSSSAPASSAQSSSAPSSAETTSSSPASSSSAAATTSSSSSAAAASSSSPATSSDLQNRVLAYHNDLRALHDAEPLVWDDSLAAAATSWANNCVDAHSGDAIDAGENLASGTSNYSLEDFMGMWADEEGSYDASTESGAGHFTQMVWKGTTSIGCAIQTSCDLADYDPKFWPVQFFVCEYGPAGNVIGHYAENVSV